MRRRHIGAVVAAVLLCTCAAGAGAQFRLDFEIALPVFQGLNPGDLGISGGATISRYLFLLPGVEAAYQFDEGPVRFGVGARAVTFILESLAWPDTFVEMDINHVVIRGDLGGGFFLSFGGVNQVPRNSWTWVVPQIDIGFTLSDSFRLSGGAIALAPLDNLSNFGFLLYVNARFTVLFK
jgi:hypothetical protein